MKKLLCFVLVIAIASFQFCYDALAVDNTIVIGNLVSLSGKFDEAFIGIICFFIIKIVLNILMILKRIYCVLSNN